MEPLLAGLQAIAEACGVSVASAGIVLGMFTSGLLAGVFHCAGMCGPFVLVQLPAAAGDGVGLRRLGAGLLPAYHLGRAATYAMLGAASGGAAQLVTSATGLRWLAAILLLLAAMVFAARAVGRTAPVSVAAQVFAPLSRSLGGLAARTQRLPPGLRQLGLGFVLGFLPCHMIYAGLGVAAATGSAASGALAMAAFAAGAAPSLMAVGWLGGCAAGRWKRAAAAGAPALLLVNATVLAVLAVRLIS
jgi:hypothetical protein